MIAAITVLRALAAVLSLYHMGWSWCGAVAIARGEQTLRQLGMAAVFFVCLSIFIFQMGHFVDPAAPGRAAWTLAGLVSLNIGLSLYAWFQRRAKAKRLARLDDVLERPDLALPLIDLAREDPVEAERIVREVLHLIADRRVRV